MQLVIYMLAVRNAGTRGDFERWLVRFIYSLRQVHRCAEDTERMESSAIAKGVFEGRFAGKPHKSLGTANFTTFRNKGGQPVRPV
jgi:hypothetical protein